VKKAFQFAQELRTDPFAIKRQLPSTPEAMTPLFARYELRRENLAAKMIIGYGQARVDN
jgi:hypothetical protein